MLSNSPRSETLSDIVKEALEAAASAEEDMTDANKADPSPRASPQENKA